MIFKEKKNRNCILKNHFQENVINRYLKETPSTGNKIQTLDQNIIVVMIIIYKYIPNSHK